jgi:hypothetical protein
VFGSAKTDALRHLVHRLPDISTPFSDFEVGQESLVEFVYQFWEQPTITKARKVCADWQKYDGLAGHPVSPQAVDAIRQWTEGESANRRTFEAGNFQAAEETDSSSRSLAPAPTAANSGPAEETDTSGPVVPTAKNPRQLRARLFSAFRPLTKLGLKSRTIRPMGSETAGSGSSETVESGSRTATASGRGGSSQVEENSLFWGYRLVDPKAEGADDLAYALKNSVYSYIAWANKARDTVTATV